MLRARSRAPGGQVLFDSTVRHQGRGSPRLQLADAEERPFIALSTSAFLTGSLQGQVITVSGWVRTWGFRGRAGIHAFAHPATLAGSSTSQGLAADSLLADTDWRRLEPRLPVKPTAGGFEIGVRALGSGQLQYLVLRSFTAWLPAAGFADAAFAGLGA